MYNETNILTKDILNQVENRMVDLYNELGGFISSTYTKKNWVINEPVIVNDVKHIEDNLEALGSHLSYPGGWEPSREWNLSEINNISYKDINRWLKNIDVLLNYGVNPLVPSEILYPKGDFLYPKTTIYPATNLYTSVGEQLVPTNKKEV